MRKKTKRKVILIDGIRYYSDKPESCRKCFCEDCCSAKGQPCVSAVCYKELDRWLQATRANRAKKEGAAFHKSVQMHMK